MIIPTNWVAVDLLLPSGLILAVTVVHLSDSQWMITSTSWVAVGLRLTPSLRSYPCRHCGTSLWLTMDGNTFMEAVSLRLGSAPCGPNKRKVVTIDMLPSTIDMLPSTIDMLPSTIDMLPSTIDMLPSTIDMLPSTIDILPSTIDMLPSTIDMLPSTIDMLPSTIDMLPSTIDMLPSTIDMLPSLTIKLWHLLRLHPDWSLLVSAILMVNGLT